MEDNYREVKKVEPCLKLIHMDLVEVEEIEWLFYPFIPYGKVTIIQGDPGEGKTTVVLQIIAKLTKGEAILSETSEGKSEEAGVEPINVIYQTAEDGLGDTIKPRLLAAGADCSRVLVIDDQDQPLTMVDARLEEAIIQTKARLVVLDPIQGFLGAGVDMHRANEIRPLMKRISVLAEKYQCAIILIGHMNKNSNGKSSYRGLGSIDFQAAARSVLIVGRVKDEPEIRVMESCDSLERGVITMYNQVISGVNSEYDILLEECDVDSILKGNTEFYEPAVVKMTEGIAQDFVTDLLSSIRERGIDTRSTYTVFIGGGAALLKKLIEKSDRLGKYMFIEDICANAKGYDKLYQMMTAEE